ncbi:MAG: ribonuclease HI [Bdellovibrionales bacterium]|nr:ribonuclease HI [Bdellovibrionales bacterium]
MSSQFTMYSDGGAELRVAGAGACVLDETRTGKRLKLAAFVDGATNNEAEIVAGLLGLSYVRAALAESGTRTAKIHWVCDSQYVLKSATQYIHGWQRNGWKTANKQPVKNQGLWRAYLRLSAGIQVSAEFVKGHAGHPENELCDAVSTWLQREGPLLFDEPVVVQTLPSAVDSERSDWVLVDARGYLSQLRAADEPTADQIDGLVALLAGCGESIDGAGASSGGRPVLERLLLRVASLAEEATELGEEKLSEDLQRLLERYSKID